MGMTLADLKPIAKRSAEAEALERLRAAILSHRLAPGSRLTEVSLAGQLGISRATIRSALHHLVGEGLVVQVPYTGWMVTRLTPNDVWELVTLRASLESLAASLAAERASHEGRTAVSDAFAHLEAEAAAGRSNEAAAADLAFHRAIVEAAGHDRLAEHYRRVAQQISIVIASTNLLFDETATLPQQHKPIFDAVLARDAAGAAALMRAHVDEYGQKLIAKLTAMEHDNSSEETTP